MTEYRLRRNLREATAALELAKRIGSPESEIDLRRVAVRDAERRLATFLDATDDD